MLRRTPRRACRTLTWDDDAGEAVDGGDGGESGGGGRRPEAVARVAARVRRQLGGAVQQSEPAGGAGAPAGGQHRPRVTAVAAVEARRPHAHLQHSDAGSSAARVRLIGDSEAQH